MQQRRTTVISLALLASGLVAAEGDDGWSLADLNLETHGFVSFGYLKSWGNNWLGETLEGTSEFWEAAANVTARPMDRLRLGAQLFTRDIGIYGNGRVDLDWAYAEWRFDDAFGVQVGRVTVPLGLYSDALDVDAARSSVFLPRFFIYPLRSREIQQSTDGVKVFGTVGGFDWAAWLGNKEFADDGDFANNLIFASGVLSAVNDIDTDSNSGVMLHWRTPIDGLQARVTATTLQGLEVHGRSPSGTAAVAIELPEWYFGSIGLLYDVGDFTWSTEYARQHADRHVTITPDNGGPVTEIRNGLREENAYLALTWHARTWLDLYGAVEGMWNDPTDRHAAPYSQNAVTAVSVMPTSHWLFKLEYRYMHGTKDIDVSLNPGGVEPDTHVVALKTTVDF